MDKGEVQKSKIKKHKPPATEKQGNKNFTKDISDHQDVIALRKRISSLEAENKDLREQIAAMIKSASRPVQPHTDSVREQQHNFFKYSNIRRY